jgi:hypothetical protein
MRSARRADHREWSEPVLAGRGDQNGSARHPAKDARSSGPEGGELRLHEIFDTVHRISEALSRKTRMRLSEFAQSNISKRRRPKSFRKWTRASKKGSLWKCPLSVLQEKCPKMPFDAPER